MEIDLNEAAIIIVILVFCRRRYDRPISIIPSMILTDNGETIWDEVLAEAGGDPWAAFVHNLPVSSTDLRLQQTLSFLQDPPYSIVWTPNLWLIRDPQDSEGS